VKISYVAKDIAAEPSRDWVEIKHIVSNKIFSTLVPIQRCEVNYGSRFNALRVVALDSFQLVAERHVTGGIERLDLRFEAHTKPQPVLLQWLQSV
jgi:hypothetical protein